MKATVIAETKFINPYPDLIDFESDTGPELAEFAGRLCYESWDRPNPETATNEGYIKNILAQGHFSVLEHGSVTFLIEDVARSLTHELIRHRHFSYSEKSQRYVDVSDLIPITPPELRDVAPHDRDAAIQVMKEIKHNARNSYRDIEGIVADNGIKGKQRRQASRAAMPESIATNIVMTGNYRAWRHFLQMRGSKHADTAIRELAVNICRQLQKQVPYVFDDFVIETIGTGETIVYGTYHEA